MVQEIINKYGELSDSWISEIKYSKKYDKEDKIKIIEIILTCANKENDLKYEVIKLIFEDIIEFKFIEINDSDNFITGDVLIKIEDNSILFDFTPIDYFDSLKENPESNLKIKCKKISYSFIKSHI
jgi:hypothetical protein